MKNKIAIASAFLAASSFSMGEIVVNDFLSFEGFVDSSYSTNQSDIAGTKESDNSFGIDQVEISWLFNFDAVTAQIDLEYEDGDDDNNDGVEQAFVNYALGNGDVITAGRYASMLGFEAFEPTGLYQYSTAYDFSSILGDANTLIQAIPGANAGAGTSNVEDEVDNLGAQEYVQGVKYTRSTDTTFFGISLQDQAFGNDGDRLGGDVEGDSSYAVEVAGSIDLGNGLTVFAGGAFEDADSGDNQLINAYVTYETGAWLFAAEVNVSESEDVAVNVGGFPITDDVDGLGYLLMANYAYSDVASVTGRISSLEFDASGVDVELFKYTVAHNYALSDNLLLVTEISLEDIDLDVDGFLDEDGDNLVFAVELLFSF
jgi:hypothetical protein